jgi:hypothetical protein
MSSVGQREAKPRVFRSFTYKERETTEHPPLPDGITHLPTHFPGNRTPDTRIFRKNRAQMERQNLLIYNGLSDTFLIV